MKKEEKKEELEEIKEPKKNNKNIIYGIIIGILLLIIICLVAFILLKPKTVTKTNSSKKDTNTKQEVVIESKDNNEIKIVNSIKAEEFINGDYVISYINERPKTKYETKDASVLELLSTTTNVLKSKIAYCSSENKNPVTLEDINKALDEVYLEHKKITIDDVKNSSKQLKFSSPGVYYIVKSENEIYLNGPCHGPYPGGNAPQTIERSKFMQAWEDNDNLYIDIKRAYGKLENTISEYAANYTFYKDIELNSKNEIEHSNIVQKNIYIENVNANNNVLNGEWSKYNTYRYNYKKQDGKYYLSTIENLGSN